MNNGINKTIVNALKKSLFDCGQPVGFDKDGRRPIKKDKVALVKYKEQVIENSDEIAELKDNYLFIMLEEIAIDKYIYWNNAYYKVISIDDTIPNIFKMYTEFYQEFTGYIYSFEITNPNPINIKVGDTIQLNTTCKYRDGDKETIDTNPIITYTTQDSLIATISNSGLITGVGIGSSNITCSYHGYSATIQVNIAKADEYSISCDGDITLEKDKTMQLNPVVKINGVIVENPILTYVVGNNSIVTCNDGIIDGIGVGSTTITINYEDKAQCVVNVTIKEVEVVYAINGVDSFKQENSSTFTINPLRSCVFYIEDFDRENVAYITSDNGNGTCVVYGINNISDNYFTLYAKDSSGKILASKEINVLAW